MCVLLNGTDFVTIYTDHSIHCTTTLSKGPNVANIRPPNPRTAAKKTSLKMSIHVLSIFISIIPSHLLFQM